MTTTSDEEKVEGGVLLSTFPDSDDNYMKEFVVELGWLKEHIDRDIEDFMNSYIWDETLKIYQQAKFQGKILEEEEV